MANAWKQHCKGWRHTNEVKAVTWTKMSYMATLRVVFVVKTSEEIKSVFFFT